MSPGTAVAVLFFRPGKHFGAKTICIGAFDQSLPGMLSKEWGPIIPVMELAELACLSILYAGPQPVPPVQAGALHCFLRFRKAEIPADQVKGIPFLKPFQKNPLYQRIVDTPDILNDNFRLSLTGNFRENLPENASRTICDFIGAAYDGLVFPGIVTLQNAMSPFLDFFPPGIFQNSIQTEGGFDAIAIQKIQQCHGIGTAAVCKDEM